MGSAALVATVPYPGNRVRQPKFPASFKEVVKKKKDIKKENRTGDGDDTGIHLLASAWLASPVYFIALEKLDNFCS